MQSSVLDRFHPAVRAWFSASFAAPTEAQAQAWPAIHAGEHVLLAAPTGSGKTLAAFLCAIDALVREGTANNAGGLPDETRVVYVSPLKALSNDIQRNLEAPLAGISTALQQMGIMAPEIRTWVRTGDTSQSDRGRMKKRAPHIVVTTPESLYILLTSKSGRDMLRTTRTIIVDEIHALAPNKRGAHLALSLERLQALTGAGLARVGLSATQKPIEAVARFLVGEPQSSDTANAGVALDQPDHAPNGESAGDGMRLGPVRVPCTIIDTGHVRQRDLAIVLPPTPLGAVMSGEVWEQLYDQLAQLVSEHRTTLVFVNTRRLAERAARHLSDRLGREHVTAHHGSLSRTQRFDAEQRLKRGELKALVATASLELGIDIGDVDLVCQLSSPHGIAAFLQRVGRSGHAVGGTPKGRLFPLSRDDLVECAALLDSVRAGELDRIAIPHQPLDVLAQQIVAEVSQQDWSEQALFDLVRRAHPYRALAREQFTEVVRMVAEGFHTRFGRRSAHVHRDAVGGMLRARRGAAIAAVTSGGTIPDMADYTVMLEPQAHVVGTVNEDFAIESLPGDVFQLGNTSYRILRVERGTVRVEDAKGAPPGIPFWFGEAPGRTRELSDAVVRLRESVIERLANSPAATLNASLADSLQIAPEVAQQLSDYLAAAHAALGALPTADTVIFERFFDESGGMQLVIHSSFGSRINRAWGLALRKRFCRKFNFELQAAAIEDAIVLSLSTSHSFELAEVARYLSSQTVRPLLIQALLDAPMFPTRWRWNASIALALLRFRGGRKVAPQLQRMQAEDLLATVFPDQVACGENIVGDREVPDHPLVAQTIDDCLHDAMDIDGLERVLRGIEQGAIRVIARDLTEPSPLALEILSARPYAFLDDAPLEERRTQAVMARRWLDPQTANDLGRLDPAAITRVREEVWPTPRNAEELHDALLGLSYLERSELRAGGWETMAEALIGARRATWLALAPQRAILVAAERLPLLQAIFRDVAASPPIDVPAEFRATSFAPEDALVEVMRDRLGALGPVTASALAASLAMDVATIEAALARLEIEGAMMRGRFSPDASDVEWCDRHLLARIHRYTVNRLRQEIEPVAARDFLRFLLRWQRLDPAARGEGPDAVAAVISQLEGYEVPAAAWETEVLPARVDKYDPTWLDELSLAGRVVWLRLSVPKPSVERTTAIAPVRSTPIALLSRRNLATWLGLAAGSDPSALSARSQQVAHHLKERGASFFEEIVAATRLLPTQLEEALADLTAHGLVNADGFIGLRALLVPSDRRRATGGHTRRRRTALFGIEDAGRWSLVRRDHAPTSVSGRPSAKSTVATAAPDESADAIERVAQALLKRYGVVFWRLLEREAQWLPPWRELLRVYRRMEARGELRGGRFVEGISGEQFALPDALNALRDTRKRERDGTLVAVSGADPLNLIGILTPGPKLAALTANRLLYRDGVPIALLAGGEVRLLEELDVPTRVQARDALIRRSVPPLLAMFE